MNSLPILNSTKEIVDSAKFVRINKEKISLVADKVKDFFDKNPNFSESLFNYSSDQKLSAQRVLVQNSANFCFWAPKDGEPKWAVEWQGKIVGGGFGLWAVLERALAENVPILDAVYLANISLEDVKKIFRPTNGIEITHIEKRWKNLKNTGKILLEKYNGQAIKLIEEANYDAVALVNLIANNFDSYNDIADCEGKTIYFYKLAQVCASEIDASGIRLKNIDQLTAFADYKIPQLLRHFGILEYSEELSRRIASFEKIPLGSREEIEIRASTIWAVEFIKQQIPQYNSSQIDNALWLLSQEAPKSIAPYHRTETIFY